MIKKIPGQIRMQRLSLSFLIVFFSIAMQAASVTSLTSGNWSATAWPNTTRSGTIKTTTGSAVITGTGTSFLTEISVGNIIKTTTGTAIGTVLSVTDNTHLNLISGAPSTYTGISYRSQGVGQGDAVTLANGASIIVDGSFTCASLSFTAVSSNTTLTISGSNSLIVTGAILMSRPSTSSRTSTISVGSGQLRAGSVTMSATTTGRNNALSVSTGTVTITGSLTTGTTGCSITFTGAGTFNIAGAFNGTPSITQFAGNTWNYNGAAQTVKNSTYNNLIISGNGIKTFSTARIEGVLSIEESATVSGVPVYGSNATLRYNTNISLNTGTEWTDSFSSTGGIIIDNTGVVSLGSAETLSAPLIINDGATLNTKNYALTSSGSFTNNGTFISNASVVSIKGAWVNNGTFNQGTGTVIFNGSTAQTISGTGANTFYNLTISNASGISLASDASVNGTLTFTAGKISAGAFSIIMGNTAVVSGAGSGKYVFGNLVKGIAASTTVKTFETGDAAVYAPVVLTFSGTTNSSGSISVKTISGNSPEIGTSSINPNSGVNRHWLVNNDGVTGYSEYNATLNYETSDIEDGASYQSFIAGVYSSSTWQYPVTGSITTTSLQVTGMTVFGQFQIGESKNTTAVPYDGNGTIPMVSDIIPQVNMPSNPTTISSEFAAHQYFTMNVVKGISYEIYTCNSTAPEYQMALAVYKEGAPLENYIAFSSVNTGNPCSAAANNAYVTFIPSFSGVVRILVNRKGNQSSSTPAGLTVKVNVKSGSNSLDDQAMAETDKWRGHIYDGISFNNYLGYYLTESENFQEAFGTTGTWPNNSNDDVTCFNFFSGGSVRGSIRDMSYSVRYRMNSSKKGLYTASITSDDGSRLFVDGVSVFSDWTDHSPKISNNVLFSLNGSSSLIFEYYENGGQNVAGFSDMVRFFSNTLLQNLDQEITLENSGSAISGDVYGNLPAGVTLSGTGYQWAYSNSSAGPWTNISGATGATFTPSSTVSPFNAEGTYYIVRKAVVSGINNIAPNPYVATSISNSAKIVVKMRDGRWLGIKSDDWHMAANWSGGVPGSATDAEIPAGTPNQPVINSGAAVCRNLTIRSGSVLTISGGAQLNVSGILSNEEGSAGLILQSDESGTASLIHNTDNVAATVKRFFTGEAEEWHLLSSPVSNQDIANGWTPMGTYGNGTGYDLYVWDESTSCWIYKLNAKSDKNWNTVHPENNFVPGRGYLYSLQAANSTNEFTGDLNNGDISVQISSESVNADLKGFNLTGNPYPSSVDWQAAKGWSRSDLLSSGEGYDMWIWNPAASNYGVINSAGGKGTNGVSRYISPMQGFFVQAEITGNLGFTNAVRANSVNSVWMKKGLSSEHVEEAISITVTPETGLGFDEIKLVFGSKDNESGSVKLFSPIATAPSLYLPLNGENYTLRYLTDTSENREIPVMFKPGSNGDYILQFNDIEHIENLVLEDRQTNTFHNVKADHIYRFKSSEGDKNDRFILHFSPVEKPSKPEVSVPVYTANKSLIIDLSEISTASEIRVIDFMGRVLLHTNLEGQTRHSLSIDSKSQVLIVFVKNKTGIVSHKVMWSN